MEQRIGRLLTIIFHPLFIPFYMLVVLLNIDVLFAMMIPLRVKLILSGLVFLTTIVFPLLCVFFLYKLKLVRSLHLESKEERIYPLLILAVFYYLTYYLLKSFPISFIFSYYMLGSTFSPSSR